MKLDDETENRLPLVVKIRDEFLNCVYWSRTLNLKPKKNEIVTFYNIAGVYDKIRIKNESL